MRTCSTAVSMYAIGEPPSRSPDALYRSADQCCGHTGIHPRSLPVRSADGERERDRPFAVAVAVASGALLTPLTFIGLPVLPGCPPLLVKCACSAMICGLVCTLGLALVGPGVFLRSQQRTKRRGGPLIRVSSRCPVALCPLPSIPLPASKPARRCCGWSQTNGRPAPCAYYDCVGSKTSTLMTASSSIY